MSTDLNLPRLPIRLWLCLTGWKRWRQRRAIDRAAVVLDRLGHWELSHDLQNLSHTMWDNEWKRTNPDTQ